MAGRSGSTFPAPAGCAPPARPWATSRWSPRSTSCPTPWASTRFDLRLRNHADVNPQSGRPWSSNALRECYLAGAEHFGWAGRDPAVRSVRDGRWLVGYGMAGVTFGGFYGPCRASITLSRDGTARVRSAATDIGTGTYTVAAQLTAELLGLRTSQVVVEIGDSDLPPAPQSGGSGLATALSAAIHAAAETCSARSST